MMLQLFPRSLHEELLQATGLAPPESSGSITCDFFCTCLKEGADVQGQSKTSEWLFQGCKSLQTWRVASPGMATSQKM